MASRRTKLVSAASLIAILGAGGWYLHSVLAAQAQGTLAQAPLNNQVQVPPAFIMAVDDSGSMNFQTLFPGRDGATTWARDSSSGAGNVWGFHHNTGTDAGNIREASTSTSDYRFVYVAPHPAPRQSAGSIRDAAIPPFDAYGFSRSHQYNRSYYDPTVEYYSPWRNENGSYWPDSTPTAARVHPSNATPTINLTTLNASTTTTAGDDSRFSMYSGMTMPANTRYRGSGCGLTSSTLLYRTQATAFTVGGTTTNCNIHIEYFPATFYLHVDTPADQLPAGYILANRVSVQNACTYSTATGANRCDMYRYEIRPENYTGGATGVAYQNAIRNFANWFTYYGARSRAIVAGATISLAEVNNMRVGQFTINSYTSWDNPIGSTAERLSMYDMQTQADRVTLFNQLFGLTVSGTTPNMFAVDAIGKQFQRTDANAPIQRACQRNAGMLFTDGYTNQGNMSGFGNADGGMGVPFADGHSNTMADIAAYYYLNTNGTIGAGGASRLGGTGSITAGRVPVSSACDVPNPDPRLNCQTNLHMNFYGITLGATGALYDPDNPADPFVTPQAWPNHNNNSANTVDDIWHAAVNTRGDFINASTPAEITQAMRRILAAVSAGASPSGTLALTGSRISTRSLSVQPSYEVRNEGTDWFSELAAFRLSVDPVTRNVTETQIWEASDYIGSTAAAATSRGNRTWFGHASGVSQFTGTNVASLATLCNNPRPGMSRCTATEITSRLGINVNQAVSYLLGNATGEVRNGGALRNRSTRLGDIINSTPVVSAPTDDYGYRNLPSPYGSTYNAYMTTKQSRPAMVYVGANDGMLHAIHGGINHEGALDAANGGREQFAYIPRAVVGHMGNLLFPYLAADGGDQKFDHRYFVDGPISVSDAYYGSNWHTVLVGTTGAGGRSVFGLNISNPSGFSSSSRLWEIDDQHPTAAVAQRIGHVLGRPVIVPVKVGATVSWKAIFGNGYNSSLGRAALFVVDIQTGAVQTIDATETGAPTGSNGLGNIVVVDRWGGPSMDLNTRDGYADTVYAADQKGAIWKFDLRSATPSALTVPLFTTQTHTEGGSTYRQPILGGLTATAGQGGGVMLLFGTGSFSFVNDAADSTIQSIYGVLDTNAAGTLTITNLFQRNILVSTADTRTISSGAIPFGRSGWYINLPAGERAVGYPRVASGVLFIPTYSPTVTDGCSTSGMNWLYGLNTKTGTAALAGVRFGSTSGTTQGAGVGAVSLDTSGTAPVKDVGLTVLSRAAPPNPGETAPPDDGCWMRVTVPGMAQAMFVPYPCGRQSWRQIQ